MVENKLYKSDKYNQLRRLFPLELAEQMEFEDIDFDSLLEIRMRVGQYIRLKFIEKEKVPTSFRITEKQIYKVIEKACEYSLYSYEDNMKQGFITVLGGHRIGIGGHVLSESGRIKTFNKISFLCIRVAHEIVGCADSVMGFVCKEKQLKHTLIISPPGGGKTTLLRDVIRQISDGNVIKGKNVCVIDERSELAACFKGIPQNDVGVRTDVLDDCPKCEGMMMAVRSLAPQVIAIDEIGGEKDVEAVLYCMHCGCTVIGTIHGIDENEILLRPVISKILENGAFCRLIILRMDDFSKARCVEWGDKK